MQFNISNDSEPPEFVKVVESHVGKGVYAVRPYPEDSIIGEIKGELFENPYAGTSYTFEANEGYQLEPAEPFRYLNHCCQPNCEFDWVNEPATDDEPASSGLFLIASRDIRAGEQFTIDYRWPASFAIRCQCKHRNCRGWIVDRDELDKLPINFSKC